MTEQGSDDEQRLLNDDARSTTTGAVNNKIPRASFFIIGNEIAERFSFYGLKAILMLYMKNQLGFTDNVATAGLHIFVMTAYSMTLFGGILSDTYLGKYKTILYLSIVYCIGGALLSITAVPGVTGYIGNDYLYSDIIFYGCF
jgi:dipeptide/tripeptide permease